MPCCHPHSQNTTKLSEMSKASWHFRTAHWSLPHTASSFLHPPGEQILPLQCSAWALLPPAFPLAVPGLPRAGGMACCFREQKYLDWAAFNLFGFQPFITMPSNLVNAASFMFAVLRHHLRVLGVCRYRWELVCHRMSSAEEELGFIPPCKRGARSPTEAQEPAVTVLSSSFICKLSQNPWKHLMSSPYYTTKTQYGFANYILCKYSVSSSTLQTRLSYKHRHTHTSLVGL